MHIPYYGGKYRSDLCRLLQLYAYGGIYSDNDLQLLRPLDAYMEYDMTTILEAPRSDHPKQTAIFQALVMAPARSAIIRRSIELWNDWASGALKVQGLLGPTLMIAAIREATGLEPLTRSGRAALRAHRATLHTSALRVNVLLETPPTPSDFGHDQSVCLAAQGLARLRHDREANLCGYLVLDEVGTYLPKFPSLRLLSYRFSSSCPLRV